MAQTQILKPNWTFLAILAFALVCGPTAQADGLPAAEFRARRAELVRRLPDGIVLLHAKSSLVNLDQLLSHGFHQEPTFYYFTGLANAVSAILAIDAPAGQTWLFIPSQLSGMGELVSNPYVPAGAESVARLLIDRVVPWEEFQPYLDRRLRSDPKLILYTDDHGAFMFQPTAESNPPGLSPVEDPLLLWPRALRARWPNATFKSASDTIKDLRLVKGEAEVNVMRRVARASASALLAGLAAIRTGRPQRHVEAEIVRACILAGGEGPSFWPLSAAGPNSAIPNYLEALADYRHKNRKMLSGEVVHLDLGCDVDHYGGDVGRTAPVSGHYDAGQRELWNLLVRAYFAGLKVMRDGASRDEVYAASLSELARHRGNLHTELARKALAKLLAPEGTADWYLHASGVECCELGPTVLRKGMIVVFEPSVTIDGQGYYIEDMVLVTADGHEVLTAGLPYWAEEIERAMARVDKTNF